MFVFVKIFLFFLLLNGITQASIFSDYKARKAYSIDDFKKTVQILEKEQVEKPNDSIINYNLGTAYYKLNNFEKAKLNLQRAVENCNVRQKEIKEKAYFNWGNSFYKSCLETLSKDWEKEQIGDEVLDLAITEIKLATEKYGNVLVSNKDNQWASSNKKKAEELLKKLEEKKQDNKQDQNKDKQSQQDKQNNKENKDKQGDSNKKKSESNSESSQEENKDSQSQNSEQQGKGENSSQNTKKDRNEGEDKKFDNKQTGQENQDIDKREQDSSSEQSSSHRNGEQKQEQHSQKEDRQQDSRNQETGSENKKEGAEQQMGSQQVGTQQVGAGEKNDIKSKILRAVLDDLQNDEAKLQKALIKYKSTGEKPKLDQGQKPW